MKKLFGFLFLILFLVLLSPVILLGLMYQGDIDSPLPLASYQRDVSPTQMISQQLDQAFSQLESPNQDLGFTLSEEMLNTLIYAVLTQEEGLNSQYQPGSDCETDACQYLITENLTDNLTSRLKGLWVELDDDQISIFASAAVTWQDNFSYQTILSLVFNITDEEDAYQLAVDRVRLGRLPVTSRFLSRILGWVENLSGQPVIEAEGDLPIGSLDLDTFSITLPKSEIISTIEDDESLENGDLLAALLEIFFENQLLTFQLTNQGLNFSVRTSLLLSDEATVMPPRIEDLYQTQVDLDLEDYLKGRFEEYLLTQALLGDTTFRLSQRAFNTIIAAGLSGEEGLPDFSWEYENSEGIEDQIPFRMNGAWVTLREADFVIHALFDMASYPSLIEFTLAAIPSDDPFILLYEMRSLTMGRSPSNPNQPFLLVDDFEALIPLIRDWVETDFIRFNERHQLEVGGQNLEGYLNQFLEESGITISELSVMDGALILELGLDPELETIFSNYAGAINDVLTNQDFLDALNTSLDPANNKEAEDVINQINNITQKLNDNQPLSEDDVNALTDEFDDLTTEEQTAFFNAMQTFIDPQLVEEFEEAFQN